MTPRKWQISEIQNCNPTSQLLPGEPLGHFHHSSLPEPTSSSAPAFCLSMFQLSGIVLVWVFPPQSLPASLLGKVCQWFAKYFTILGHTPLHAMADNLPLPTLLSAGPVSCTTLALSPCFWPLPLWLPSGSSSSPSPLVTPPPTPPFWSLSCFPVFKMLFSASNALVSLAGSLKLPTLPNDARQTDIHVLSLHFPWILKQIFPLVLWLFSSPKGCEFLKDRNKIASHCSSLVPNSVSRST